MLAGHRTHRAGLGAHLTGPASTCETSAARRHRAGRKLDSRSGPRCPTAGHDGLAVGVGLDVMAAAVIAAIDQHIADAGCAQFTEGEFLRGWLSSARARPAKKEIVHHNRLFYQIQTTTERLLRYASRAASCQSSQERIVGQHLVCNVVAMFL